MLEKVKVIGHGADYTVPSYSEVTESGELNPMDRHAKAGSRYKTSVG